VPPVTLIIPTVHHRAALYARALRYLEASGFRGPVVVSDHSAAEHRSVVEDLSRKHQRLDLTLLRHPPEAHFLERLTLCAQAARTPYVHLHADDDFLSLAVLERLVERMEQGSAAAMGLNVHAEFASRQLSVLAKTAAPSTDAFERLMAQLESFSSVLYALRRREELISTFAFALERCPDVQFWQYLESCVAALQGPIAVVDELHYVRGLHEAKWSSTLVRQRSPDHFPYLILSPEFQPRLAAFRSALIQAAEARRVAVDRERLDAGLIHLLYRGLGAMGLPARHSRPNPAGFDAKAAFERKVSDPQHPMTRELERIFALAGE
jgi:glycosyltransferase domain-containing protein